MREQEAYQSINDSSANGALKVKEDLHLDYNTTATYDGMTRAGD